MCVQVGGCEEAVEEAGGPWPGIRNDLTTLTFSESVDHSGVTGSMRTPQFFFFFFCHLCFLKRLLESGPQGQDGHLEALDANAVLFWPSQLKEHVGLKLDACVLRTSSHA